MSIKQFGTVVMSLSALAKDFNIEQGNSNQNHYLKTLVHAKWAWQELFLNTIWSVRQKAVKVSADKTITLPSDLMLLINISVQDMCGQLQPLGYNPALNTLTVCDAPCTCKCGGADTLCGLLDSIQVRTETINIDGTDYTKTVWNRTDGIGNLVEVTELPVWNTETSAVEMDTTSRVVCKMDTDNKGCIKKTKPNRQLLVEHCGCYMPSLYDEACRINSPVSKNDYGNWNWDATARDTIHLKHVTADYVIVGYKSDGECPGEEIMIPKYAELAMKTGIINRQKMLSPNASDGDRRSAERIYEKARAKLSRLLNPIPLKVLSELHDRIPKW